MGGFLILQGILLAEYFILEVCIDDILQSSGDVIAILVLLLNSIHEFLLHEDTSLLLWHITRTDIQEVDSGANIHAPRNAFFNVDSEPQRLFLRHLPIGTCLRITTAVVSTLSLNFDAVTFLLPEDFGQHHVLLGFELAHKFLIVGPTAVSVTF